MTALPRRRRRNTILALGAGILAALIAPVLLIVGAKAIANSKAGQNALEDQPQAQAFPQTPTGMLATVDAHDALTSVTVFVLAPDSDPSPGGYDQRGGSIVAIPVNVDTESGDQLESLIDAYKAGGEEQLRLDVESATNLTIDFSAVMARDALAKFLGTLPPVTADLPRDVLGLDGTVLFPKGSIKLTAAQMAEILTTRSPDQQERLRRPDLEALWGAIGKAIGSGVQGQTLSVSQPRSFTELAARLLAGPTASRGLIAKPIDASANPKNLDIESLDRPDAILVFASIAPASMTRPGSGLSYRIEAPPGFDAQVRKTIAVLLAQSDNVVSVDLSAESKAQTTLQVYDADLAASEPADNPIFGKVVVETPDVRLADVDETIVLGTDYLEHVDLTAPDPAPSTESTPGTGG